MLKKLKHFRVYCLSFIILFDCIALPLFTDSSKTTVMYLLFSVILQIVNYILFAMILLSFGKLKLVFESLLLYSIPELIMLLFSGKLYFFGITQNDNSFQRESAVYFSACCLISAGIYYFYCLKKLKA